MYDVNKRAVDLVKEFEGLELDAYVDPVGVVTIGYGYTNRAGFGPGVKMGDRWTEGEAEAMLREGLQRFGAEIAPHIKRTPTANEFGAMVSLAYNIGTGAFSRSTFLKRFNAGDRVGAAEAMLWWNKAGGRVLRGLTRRREAERALFLSEAALAVVHAETRTVPDTPRESPAQSKTLWAQIAQWGGGGAAIGASWFGGQSDTVQIVVIAGIVSVVIAGIVVFRERLKKWAQGDR